MKKMIALIGVGVLILLGGQALSSTDDDKFCHDLVIDSCTGCHGKERACDNIGNSKKSWKGLIGLMIANGADLSKEEREQLSECMSKPSMGAVAACADVVPDAAEKK